jgi:uncharacterized protein
MSDASSLTIVDASTVAPTPWRNGGGQTRELLTRPEGSQWQLRVSLADIDRDGPFSAFPEAQRWFAVVSGAGVALRFADAERMVTPQSQPLCFDGATAPDCRLIDGPTRDLNLMVRQGSALMTAARADEDWAGSFTERGMFTLSEGALHGPNGGTTRLAAHTLVWFLAPGACRFQPHGAGRAGWWLGWSANGIRQE